jgi:hypothetical protein
VAITDGDIDHAVRALRQTRGQGDHESHSGGRGPTLTVRSPLQCPKCARAYQAGDRFCVGCGTELPATEADNGSSECPSCGAPIQEADRFCAKCGHDMAAGEVA